jgi:hypothetical protein
MLDLPTVEPILTELMGGSSRYRLDHVSSSASPSGHAHRQ